MEHCRKYDRKAVTIQRYARGYIARKQAAKLKHSRDELNEFLAKQAEREVHVAEKLRRSEVERRMRPRTTEDFEVLYNELEAWRLQQTRAIHAANLPPADRRAALQALLHKARHYTQPAIQGTLYIPCPLKAGAACRFAWCLSSHNWD